MSTQETDLFNNPMVQAAAAALTDEQKQKYAKLGEDLYNSVDFETNKVLNNLPEPMVDSVLQLVVQLRSGLHPTDLKSSDVELLKTSYGETWYTKWGYTEEDLKSK